MQVAISKRNITQRRSKGRSSKEDGTTVPDSSIAARRPRSRSKDRRYSVESTVMDPEFQDSTMPGFEPDTWPDLGLFRGSFSRSPASPAKVQGTILTEPHQDTQSVTRGVQRLEQLQTRSGDEEALVGNPKLS
jgi:hypothetical protein